MCAKSKAEFNYRDSTGQGFHSYSIRCKVPPLTIHRLRAVMFQRLWAAAAALVIATPVLAQNPPAPPPQPAPSATDSAKARQLPRPQRPAPSNVTVTTGAQNQAPRTGGILLDSTLLA